VTRRTERVGEELRAGLARLLREEAADPRLELVTLTRVDVAPDLSSARVFWSSPHADTEEGAERVGRGLAAAAAFLRRRLARTVTLKRMPELRFLHDPSLVRGAETLALLRELSDEPSE
jgi:ribosome-binding factor A